MSVRASLVLLGTLFVAAHLTWLPPDGWVTGDQGSKFLQARAFALQGPFNPGIEVLARDFDPEYRNQEPKLENRRGRLVSEFLWLLPLLTAPFYYALGMHGLYVVPALAVIAIFLAAAALGRRLGDKSGVWTAWIVLLVTPALLYGLELWEHAPATACVMSAAVLLVPDGNRSPRIRLALAGAAIAVGALFREEVLVAIPALLIARWVSFPRRPLPNLVADGVWAAVGAGAVLAAAVPVNLMIYGAPLPMHMTHDAWDVARTTPYLSTRQDIMRHLLLPARREQLFLVAVIAGLAAAMAQAWRRSSEPDVTSGVLLTVVHLAAIVAVGIGVGSPLWRLAHGLRVQDSYDVISAAHTWPFVLALLYVPWTVGAEHRPLVRYLVVSGLLTLALTIAIVPTDGGAQWSPRFLLAAAPLLAAGAAATMARPRARLSLAVTAVIAGILCASAAMQIHGVIWLQQAKADTARLTRAFAALTAPGDVIFSNVYWFPELTASLVSTRRMLYYSSSSDLPAAAAMVVTGGVRKVATVTSFTLTGYQPPQILEMPGAPCRLERAQSVSMEFGLILSQYACAAP